MRLKYPILTYPIGFIIGIVFGIGVEYIWNKSTGIATPVHLEEVLVVKELHLVRHEYNDLFLLYRKNDKSKAIRAVAQVPVTVTAYLDLNDMQWIKQKDSIKKVVLPRARLADPAYHLDQMQIRETRGFQLHVGGDLYPKVSQYLSQIIAERQDTIRQRALDNKILSQVGAEGKYYIETLLQSIGRGDVRVTFSNEGEMESMTDAGLVVVSPRTDTLNPGTIPGNYFIHTDNNTVILNWIPLDQLD